MVLIRALDFASDSYQESYMPMPSTPTNTPAAVVARPIKPVRLTADATRMPRAMAIIAVR